MTKPGQGTTPVASRPISLPPLSQHLREFAANRHAWAVLARNLIPVVGVYFFGWSAALSVFSYWFDGLTALIAIITVMIPRALRESQPKEEVAGQNSGIGAMAKKIFAGVVTWVLLIGIVGLPYWIVLIPLHQMLLGNEVRQQIAHSPALWFTFGSLVSGHLWKAFRSGYDTMPDIQLKQRLRWDVYLLVLRAVAMFIMAAHSLYFVLVPLMALLLTYMEVWPERVLGAVWGDPSRLWEYDPEEERKNQKVRSKN